jgi:DNA repair exonuclease SbcCD ATPase subunit
MKNIGLILVAGVTVPILLLVGVYILWPRDVPPQPVVVISIDDDIAPIATELAQQEATAQAELDALNNIIQQKQTEFENQTQSWQTDMNQAQAKLTSLQTTAQTLQTEITGLEISRILRLNSYQTELEQARRQTQIEQLQTQLQEQQTELDRLNTQLEDQ